MLTKLVKKLLAAIGIDSLGRSSLRSLSQLDRYIYMYVSLKGKLRSGEPIIATFKREP